MTLTKYNPDRIYRPNSFSSLIDKFFDDTFQGGSQMDFSPSVDIAETDQAFEIQVQLPGVKKNDVDISLENDMITISGEKKYADEKDEKDYHTRESFFGKFSRSFRLPDSVNADKISAKQEDGVLVVNLPKDEKKLAKKQIKIG